MILPQFLPPFVGRHFSGMEGINTACGRRVTWDAVGGDLATERRGGLGAAATITFTCFYLKHIHTHALTHTNTLNKLTQRPNHEIQNDFPNLFGNFFLINFVTFDSIFLTPFFLGHLILTFIVVPFYYFLWGFCCLCIALIYFVSLSFFAILLFICFCYVYFWVYLFIYGNVNF